MGQQARAAPVREIGKLRDDQQLLAVLQQGMAEGWVQRLPDGSYDCIRTRSALHELIPALRKVSDKKRAMSRLVERIDARIRWGNKK